MDLDIEVNGVAGNYCNHEKELAEMIQRGIGYIFLKYTEQLNSKTARLKNIKLKQ
ncbi:hypothetical protein LU631_09795 [Erwinia tracheiphila]|uniref:hypothetical protein n=1 Tax=Erwinia tracheiphila TaxID=65700 RepID=UPI0003A17F7E|nr:hypothetical protein [Erwinia tracheiphila]UIA82269.1 hypothetical protein LU604_17000 [Erwinia tracheiphila]UIA89451.1 hypothetical protein LU631_09795 [Erwinia tracheiphila]UIA90865.1 hypothetical protein LU632_16585 [Erwinia tracheiphila]UIA97833.1 hypothetical protein LU633_08475 [Erwinia tracheiphila]